jgi:hypothetical protein
MQIKVVKSIIFIILIGLVITLLALDKWCVINLNGDVGSLSFNMGWFKSCVKEGEKVVDCKDNSTLVDLMKNREDHFSKDFRAVIKIMKVLFSLLIIFLFLLVVDFCLLVANKENPFPITTMAIYTTILIVVIVLSASTIYKMHKKEYSFGDKKGTTKVEYKSSFFIYCGVFVITALFTASELLKKKL